MILWANRLYPKKRGQSPARGVYISHGGDTNIQYTLPVAHEEISQNIVQNVNAQVVNSHAESRTQYAETRVRDIKNAHSETYAPSNVTYQTTVQVEMVNHNQIHGEQDMLRLAQYLRDTLEETLASSAEGVL